MTGRVNSFTIIYTVMLGLLTGTTLNYISVVGQVEDEIPTFEGIKPGFTPPPESQRTPPPPPPDALTVSELPAPSLPRENETDVDPLSVTNRTEILEILPLNSSNIVEFVDEELKNNTGVGLVPSSVLENITLAQEGQPSGNLSNTTILDMLGPQEIEEVANMTAPTGEGGEILDLDEQDIPSVSTSANETEDEEEVDEEEGITSPPAPTNETSAAANATTETTEVEEEGITSPPAPTNETSAAADATTETTEVEKDEIIGEDDEAPSPTGTPEPGREFPGLDNKTIDPDLNQTSGLLRENITILNDTSIFPTDENSDEPTDENSDEPADAKDENDNE
jgi:hypothetical protein